MTRHSLAIPVVVFAVALSVHSPSLAQNFLDNPRTQIGSSSVAPVHPPQTQTSLSDEDMARLLLVRRDYREAQELFYKLTMQEPKNATYWNELGISLHSQSLLAAALKCYQKSAKLDSHYPDAVNNAGTIWYEEKKYARAIRAYHKAIGIKPDFAPFYVNLGYAYFNDKKYDDSILSFRKALEIDPSAFDPSRSRSGTVIQDRSVGTDRGRFYFMLAKSFAEAGNLERCIVYLKKSKDEGFADFNSVKTDPSFAAVIKLPALQELIEPKPVAEAVQP
ncbi:MAG: tetratricopeptide repeat protein [Candidatus Acidiferrum sp.]